MSLDKINAHYRRVWVVRAKWKTDACQKCKEFLIFTLEKENLTLPNDAEKEFMAPYQFLELVPCGHDGSPHPGLGPIESVYGSKPRPG